MRLAAKPQACTKTPWRSWSPPGGAFIPGEAERLVRLMTTSNAAESGLALLFEGADSLAVVNGPAKSLNTLETLWTHRMSTRKDSQLLLHDRDGEGCVLRNSSRQFVSEIFDLFCWYHVIDHAETFCPLR